MLRRLIASLAFVAITLSSAEAVIGELRDGEVHHESLAEAAAHDHGLKGEREHEHGSPHGPDHQHGTSSDHCTHQHGEQLNGVEILLAAGPSDAFVSFFEPSLLSDRVTEPFFRPPRA